MIESDGIYSLPTPRLFTIDAGRPFLRDLAHGLLEAIVTDDPLALADMEILLPTRRAARALADAFVQAGPRRASILPRIRPIGDVDEDEIAVTADFNADDIDLPPAASPLERRLVLARLVAEADKMFSGQERWPAAIAAADELASLLDSFYAEEIDFARLDDLTPSEHAAHWERSLKFLRIVTDAWPDYLARTGQIDPAQRRGRLIDLRARQLVDERPAHPIIIAGTTGSAPAVARLMRAVASLPNGAVVLPGLDRALVRDAKAWSVIEDPHPQAGLKALLAFLERDASTVAAWPRSATEAAPSRRAGLLSLALRPAEATDDWRALVTDAAAEDPHLSDATRGLAIVEAEDEEAEAAAIAILMREALEAKERTAMLVTPDRTLARRVAAKLRRWNIAVDDSAGVPFANSPCGTYLRLAAAWLATPSDPHAALALVKHPLAGFGFDTHAARTAVIAFDAALRGLAPGPGLAGLAAKVASSAFFADRAGPLVTALVRAAQHWPTGRSAPFTDYLAAHVEVAENIAATSAEEGQTRLWRGEDGEAGASLLAELRETAMALGSISADDYAQAFSQILAGASLRRRSSAHPRLSILGPLEARLQSSDLMILSGLNEGVWPGDAGADPFLSRPMRKTLGLPSLERRVGLAAHDFAQGAAAPEVVVTRALRSGGAPAKPSRWIVRLKNILAGAGTVDAVDKSTRLAAWASALDAAGPVKRAPPPRPTPPVASRPRALYVTQVEKWLRNPYGIYARYVLGLRKLDALDEQFGARHVGNLLHKVYERAATENASRARLSELLDEESPVHGLGARERAFWRTGLEASLDWFSAFHADHLAVGAPAVLEQTGSLAIGAPAGPFVLSARADRIDLAHDGSVFLFDYKSGAIPTAPQMKTFRVQLPLTALIMEGGGFAQLGPRALGGFAYVKTYGVKSGGDMTAARGADAAAMVAKVGVDFAAWIAAFDDEATPYLSQPRPQFLDDHSDYDHLARRCEWNAGGDE